MLADCNQTLDRVFPCQQTIGSIGVPAIDNLTDISHCWNLCRLLFCTARKVTNLILIAYWSLKADDSMQESVKSCKIRFSVG